MVIMEMDWSQNCGQCGTEGVSHNALSMHWLLKPLSNLWIGSF